MSWCRPDLSGSVYSRLAGYEDTNDVVRLDRDGAQSVIIGEVTEEHPGRVVMKTSLGATRIVDMLVGELLPRIC